jgi:hypothetical protein
MPAMRRIGQMALIFRWPISILPDWPLTTRGISLFSPRKSQFFNSHN